MMENVSFVVSHDICTIMSLEQCTVGRQPFFFVGQNWLTSSSVNLNIFTFIREKREISSSREREKTSKSSLIFAALLCGYYYYFFFCFYCCCRCSCSYIFCLISFLFLLRFGMQITRLTAITTTTVATTRPI